MTLNEDILYLKELFLENPEDEITRLILADALEEEGASPQNVFTLRQPGECTQRHFLDIGTCIFWETVTPYYAEIEITRLPHAFACNKSCPNEPANEARFFREGNWWCPPCYVDFKKGKIS